MNPEEREAYLAKKKEEMKLKLRQIMKQKCADAKKVRFTRSIFSRIVRALTMRAIVTGLPAAAAVQFLSPGALE